MPELPEVECLSRAIRKLVLGGTLEDAKFYREDLREPIPKARFRKLLNHQTITAVSRRSKYLLLETSESIGIFHLGMSGKILAYDESKPQLKHTHAVFKVRGPSQNLVYLHFVDPRRFGFINCCTREELADHRFFKHLGPEPLATKDLAGYLFKKSRNRRVPIKNFLMNAQVVVGVGNIYANESLFRSRIHPLELAANIPLEQFKLLGKEIKKTLKEAIKSGGTTLKDFQNPVCDPGYFSLSLKVYGRENEPCVDCDHTVEKSVLGNRATYFCPECQVLA